MCVSLTDVLLKQPQHFAVFGVAIYSMLGEDEIAVHEHIKDAGRAGDESQFLDDVLVVLDKFCCRAHGAIGVVSGNAVFN